jgi:hypothetical protein
MTNRLMITVDVEAFPKRAEKDHVDRLIWGRYPDGRGGIGEMMDIADKYGVKLVMFLDYIEEYLWGDQIMEVAREIHARGHDLQLHSHPENFPDAFWEERGIPRLKLAGNATDEQADAMMAFLCDRQMKATGVAPIAYRGGGYRYGPATVRAMGRHGVRLNSSYVATSDNQLFKAGRLPQFKWDNGCLEVPISCMTLYQSQEKFYHLNFNHSSCADVRRMMMTLEAFYRQMGDDAIAMMVMHSWSFSKEGPDGHFSTPIPDYLERFDRFLAAIAGKIEVIDSATAVRLLDSGAVPVAGVVAIDAMAEGSAAFTRTNAIESGQDPHAWYRRVPPAERMARHVERWKMRLKGAHPRNWRKWRKKLVKFAARMSAKAPH